MRTGRFLVEGRLEAAGKYGFRREIRTLETTSETQGKRVWCPAKLLRLSGSCSGFRFFPVLAGALDAGRLAP